MSTPPPPAPDGDAAQRPGEEPGSVATAPAVQQRTVGQSILAGVREVAIVLGLALLLSFIVKTWLLQAFYIPSASMEDTLVKNDRVIVSKLTPGPFALERGDIVVFEDPGTPEQWLPPSEPRQLSAVGKVLTFVGLLPEDSDNHLIKRVIGLPGDHIVSDGGTGELTVNGVAVNEPYIKPGVSPSEGRAFDIVVPQDSVWVMGDNRSDSSDSRFHDYGPDGQNGNGLYGSVPMDKIVGRAMVIVWPLDHVTWLGTPESSFSQVPTGTSTPTAEPALPSPEDPGFTGTEPVPDPSVDPGADEGVDPGADQGGLETGVPDAEPTTAPVP